MKILKSAKHHWWPRALSASWATEDGVVHRVRPDGSISRGRPDGFRAINNGHHIRLGSRPDVGTPWDESFEGVFDQPDREFAATLQWLRTMEEHLRGSVSGSGAFVELTASDELHAVLRQQVISLAVRSPRTRELFVGLAERLRGDRIGMSERRALIGLNLRDCQRRFVAAVGSRGKLAIIHSPEREFIFGDGFYHNFTSPAAPPTSPRLLVPLTPRTSILFAVPLAYEPQPALVGCVVTAKDAEALNSIVQIYSASELFYRLEAPGLTEEFRCGQHRELGFFADPVARFVDTLPGVASLLSRHLSP